MTSFSALLSTLGEKAQAPPATSTNRPSSTQPTSKADGASDRFRLTPNNAVAGVKRRAEDSAGPLTAKTIKTEQKTGPNQSVTSGSRFQLTAKNGAIRPVPTAGHSSERQGKTAAQTGIIGMSTPPSTTNATAKPKKSFAAILERAKAAEAAAKASGGGGIKHKPVEKLTRKQRLQMMEETKAQQRAGKKGLADRSRSGTPNGASTSVLGAKKVSETSTYKGTMKKPAPAPLAYKGTMRAAADPSQPKRSSQSKQKGQAQDKYGGYASWSDLDDAEDEDEEPRSEDGFDESDEDMEGGFDDLAAEEEEALKHAKREDLAAAREEERLKKEKLERKRKLEKLAMEMKGKKKF
ncbi:hypothetical protein LTR62_004954 [Meristemomyces frigidus]|uniref:Uncharacterized protein n=1 Tax=Meristemomyces frigidus TaxID=1508187 RepID=A0AAN7TN45_9PEZI|nr:hypothetical protein LTR62_004954 [Meristemomyces frigidus]